LGRELRVADWQRRPSLYRSSFALEEWDVLLDDGTMLPLVFKRLDWSALSPEARAAKPSFLYSPRREVEVYRQVLGAGTSGTAICYDSAADQAAGVYWLLLERVAGLGLCHVGEIGIWQDVAGWVGAMHARFQPGAEGLCERVSLIEYTPAFYAMWRTRARAFLRRSHPSAPATSARIDWLLKRHRIAVERLVELPRTLLHGEFYPSNLLIVADGGAMTARRICPIDWELAALGPGLMDLAALISGSWSEQQRDAIVTAYPGGADADDVLACRLQVAVQWLGWAPQWTPPREHEHDWFAEALELAERIT
jgi:Phosphotransferase enzyme family